MIYKLDDTPLSNYNALPLIDGGCIALGGAFDLPTRKGETSYNWGTSIEPYLDVADIEIEGRELTFDCVVQSIDKPSLVENINHLTTAFIACQKFSTTYAEFDVVCRDAIRVEMLNDVVATMHVKLWQPHFVLPELTIQQQSGVGLCQQSIDGYDLFEVFGIVVEKIEGEKNMANRIEVATTSAYTQTQYREQKEIVLHCSMRSTAGLVFLYRRMLQFQALCYQSGLRTLQLNEFQTEVYFKNGFRSSLISSSLLKFILKGLCVSGA